MKILYLLFPFFLLLIQGAAGERDREEMGEV